MIEHTTSPPADEVARELEALSRLEVCLICGLASAHPLRTGLLAIHATCERAHPTFLAEITRARMELNCTWYEAAEALRLIRDREETP